MQGTDLGTGTGGAGAGGLLPLFLLRRRGETDGRQQQLALNPNPPDPRVAGVARASSCDRV